VPPIAIQALAQNPDSLTVQDKFSNDSRVIKILNEKIEESSISLADAQKLFEDGKQQQVETLKEALSTKKVAVAKEKNKQKKEILNAAAKKLQFKIDSVGAVSTNAKIDSLQKELASWEADKVALVKIEKQAADNRASTIDSLTKVVEILKAVKAETQNVVPFVMTNLEARRRKNANILRMQELAFLKLATSSVEADYIKGYEGWLINYSKYFRCTFYIHNINGGEEVPLLLEPGDRISHNLLPGRYMYWIEYASINNGGFVYKEAPQFFNVGPQKKFVSDPKVGWTHWAVWKY
jgi:hypothetical protein